MSTCQDCEVRDRKAQCQDWGADFMTRAAFMTSEPGFQDWGPDVKTGSSGFKGSKADFKTG
jgi:hypothetical protein